MRRVRRRPCGEGDWVNNGRINSDTRMSKYKRIFVSVRLTNSYESPLWIMDIVLVVSPPVAIFFEGWRWGGYRRSANRVHPADGILSLILEIRA